MGKCISKVGKKVARLQRQREHYNYGGSPKIL